MKKLFLLVTLSIAGVMSASNVVSSSDSSKKTNEKEVIQEQNKECKFIEYKVVAGDCLYRECTVTTQHGPDGNSYTEKTCTPWVSVPCPTTGPQKPVLSLG